MGLFDGKVAIVTGAGRGIGRAEAMLLASEGARVVVNDLGGAATGEGHDAGPAAQVVEEITAAGGEAVANNDDISSWAGAEALVGQAVTTWGRLDVLINNAGILRDRMSFNMDEADWDAVINVHLKGHFATARFAAAHWRSVFKETARPVGAAIVNTASESGLYGNAGQANYAAAKAGIASLTIVLARELERMGVRVNALAPVALTRLTANLMPDVPDERKQALDPANVAAAAAWLASDLANGVTGQVLKVQGGLCQIVQGWRPISAATSDGTWTVQSIDAAREQLFAHSSPALPPFFFDVGAPHGQ